MDQRAEAGIGYVGMAGKAVFHLHCLSRTDQLAYAAALAQGLIHLEVLNGRKAAGLLAASALDALIAVYGGPLYSNEIMALLYLGPEDEVQIGSIHIAIGINRPAAG